MRSSDLAPDHSNLGAPNDLLRAVHERHLFAEVEAGIGSVSCVYEARVEG